MAAPLLAAISRHTHSMTVEGSFYPIGTVDAKDQLIVCKRILRFAFSGGPEHEVFPIASGICGSAILFGGSCQCATWSGGRRAPGPGQAVGGAVNGVQGAVQNTVPAVNGAVQATVPNAAAGVGANVAGANVGVAAGVNTANPDAWALSLPQQSMVVLPSEQYMVVPQRHELGSPYRSGRLWWRERQLPVHERLPWLLQQWLQQRLRRIRQRLLRKWLLQQWLWLR